MILLGCIIVTCVRFYDSWTIRLGILGKRIAIYASLIQHRLAFGLWRVIDEAQVYVRRLYRRPIERPS